MTEATPSQLQVLLQSLATNPELSFVRALQERFPASEIYLVGGAVRDAAIGRTESKDYDFVIRQVAPEALQEFLATLGHVNLVGKTFGVFKFIPHPITQLPNYPITGPIEPIDIALPRRESPVSRTGAYRDFAIYADPFVPIEDDLSRRDFTINAMALRITPHLKLSMSTLTYVVPQGERIEKNYPSPLRGEGRVRVASLLIDPFGGLRDIEQKTIRAVGNAEERFKEDYGRMLRAIRFACQLNFDIEKNTWEALKELALHINDRTPNGEYVVPRETVGKELVKAFANHPARALDLFETAKLLQILMPEVLAMKGCPQPPEYHTEGDVWTHTRMALEALTSKEFKDEFSDHSELNANLVLATLWHDMGKPTTLTTPERNSSNRIRFDGHSEAGASTARMLCERLRVGQYPKDSPLHVDAQSVAWLIGHHLLLISGDIAAMKPATIEKYFFKDKGLGDNLLKLTFVDGASSITKEGKKGLQNFYHMKERIQALEALHASKQGLPDPLLSGEEIMEVLGIPSGPQIGKALEALREAQLEGKVTTKDEAKIFLISAIVK